MKQLGDGIKAGKVTLDELEYHLAFMNEYMVRWVGWRWVGLGLDRVCIRGDLFLSGWLGGLICMVECGFDGLVA